MTVLVDPWQTGRRLEELEAEWEWIGLYRFWQEGVDWNRVQRMQAPWIDGDGGNCTSSYNGLLGKMGEEGFPTYPIGGTTDFCSALGSDGSGNWERFDINKNYPFNIFLVSPYTDSKWQGHNARVKSMEDEDRNQWMAGSDAGDGIISFDQWGRPAYGVPGLNFKRTMAETEEFSGFVWAGTLPGVPIVDGYPGDYATSDELIDWIVQVSQWYSVPGRLLHYFVNTCLTENTPVLDPDRDYESLRDIPGYWTPVDHRSFGPVQMQDTWWPLPWDFASSLICFLQALWVYSGRDYENLPDDQWGTAQSIQAIWQSFDPTGSNYAATYEWAKELTAAAVMRVERATSGTTPEEPEDPATLWTPVDRIWLPGVHPPSHGVVAPDGQLVIVEGAQPVPIPDVVEQYTPVEGLWVPGDQGHVWAEAKEDGKVEIKPW